MNTKKTFYDIHCHAMTFQHPNFLAYLNNLGRNLGGNLISDLFSPDYILDRNDRNKLLKIKNMIGVFENDISSLFRLMEDDLKGVYSGDSSSDPFIRSGRFHFRGTSYDRIVICPLIMDFQNQNIVYDDIYYRKAPRKSMVRAVENIFSGINEFYRKNPESIIRIYPFLGINTVNYSLKELEEFLNRYLTDKFKNRFLKENIVNLNAKLNLNIKPVENLAFTGIKLYPPLGFDPWPEDNYRELEKVKFLYEYCLKHKMPLTVHCDDQGFRTVSVKDAWLYTSPLRWKNVLENYPELKVNFAHFGKQYFRNFGFRKQYEWFNKILDYMAEYPGVYTDISFNLTISGYLDSLHAELEKRRKNGDGGFLERIMFGTDFPVNLSKIDSYIDYYRKFENSRFTDDEILLFASENPENFIF